MANATIKITQLPSIGNALSVTTVLPVVNTTGTAITEKTTLGSIANLILTQAGNTLPAAFISNIAYSVANAAQPNITSVGTLNINTLHVSGGTNGQYLQTDGTGNLTWVSGGGSGNGVVGGANAQLQFNNEGNFGGDAGLTWAGDTGVLSTLKLSVSSNATIYGNTALTNLNVAGNLTTNNIFTDNYFYANGYVFGGGGGNGVPGGNTTQVQFNDNGVFGGNTGFTFNKTAGILSSPFLAGNGNGLSNIQGANVSGAVGSATYAGTANAVAGANVSGAVSFAGTANSVAVANVVGIGNIAVLALDGSTSNVLYGNGHWGPVTGGAGSELVNGNNSFVLDSAGNVVFEGTPSGNAVDRGLVWDYGANANGVNSMIRQDLNGLSVRAWTENGGNYNAPVNIITGQDANTNTWRFDGQGNLTVPSGSINSISDAGSLGAYITLTPDLGFAQIAGREAESNVGYTNTSWSTATYTGTQIDFTNAPDLVAFFTNNTFNVGVNQTISINGDESVPFTGYSTGASNAVTVYTSVTASPDPTTVTSINFFSQLESYVNVDYDAGILNVNATGLTINIDNDQTSGPDINIRSGDDILLQAKDKALGSESEGGDINIYAGDGADDDGAGNISSTGGDIQITAGNGGDGNSGSGSAGGFTQIYGGTGGAAGVTNTAGPGGYVSINGGDGGYDNGNTQLGAGGGYVSINAGLSTQEGVNGPNVTITSGQGGPNALAGSVEILTPASVDGPGGTWTFDGYGNLILPNNSNIATIGNVTQFNTCSNGFLGLNSYDAGGNNVARVNVNSIDKIVSIGLSDPITEIDYNWTFDDTGLLSLPGNTVQIGSQYGSEAILASNVAFGVVSQGSAGMTALQWTDDISNTSQFSAVYINDSSANVGDIQIRTGAVGNANIWKFGNDGNLTLPSNTFSVNYANGTPVSIGSGGGNTGNVTFDNVTVQGVNGLNLSAGSDFTANLAYLQVRAGDVASHIHLDTGNNSAYDLIVGDDQNYVQVSSTGNILLSSYDSNTAQYTWTLDYNGNLILAGGNSVIQSIANSSLDPLNPNVSTMVFTPDPGYSSQALVLDPTAPGHIHLRAPGANIDEPSANIFLGGEDSSFEVGYYTGSAPNVFIHSNNYTWTFGTNGNLSIPGNLNYGGSASPAPSINGFSSASFAGNVVAGNLLLNNGVIQGGVDTVVTDGINSIALALGAQMDVFGFPFSGGGVRGQLTISDITTPSEANGTWYYQSINTYTYQIYTDSTYSTLVDATGWSAYTGGGVVAITKNVPAANIVIDSNGFLTTFDNTGQVSFPGNISGNTNGFTIGYLNIPQVAASNTTLALSDAGKHYYSTTAGNFTLTVPNNTTTSFATGTAISIVVQAAGNILVNAASGVTLFMAGNSTAANRVVGGYGMATLMKVATDTWFINGTGVA